MAAFIPFPSPKTHVVEYKVRGWIFRTDPLTLVRAEECLNDFKRANPTITFAAKIVQL